MPVVSKFEPVYSPLCRPNRNISLEKWRPHHLTSPGDLSVVISGAWVRQNAMRYLNGKESAFWVIYIVSGEKVPRAVRHYIAVQEIVMGCSSRKRNSLAHKFKSNWISRPCILYNAWFWADSGTTDCDGEDENSGLGIEKIVA